MPYICYFVPYLCWLLYECVVPFWNCNKTVFRAFSDILDNRLLINEDCTRKVGATVMGALIGIEFKNNKSILHWCSCSQSSRFCLFLSNDMYIFTTTGFSSHHDLLDTLCLLLYNLHPSLQYGPTSLADTSHAVCKLLFSIFVLVPCRWGSCWTPTIPLRLIQAGVLKRSCLSWWSGKKQTDWPK